MKPFIVALLPLLALRGGDNLGVRPLEACLVLQSLSQFHCKNIIITGELIDGPTGYLGGAKCTEPISVKGINFPRVINLEYGSAFPTTKCPQKPNEAEAPRNRIYQTMEFVKPGNTVTLTLEGILETHHPIDGLVGGTPPGRFGFGHLAMAPARIIVNRVIDVKVEKSSEKKGPHRTVKD